MQILLEYSIFSDYFDHLTRIHTVKEAIFLKFQEVIQSYNLKNKDKTYKYYRLEYDDNVKPDQDSDFNKSKIIKTSSLLYAYNYFLFDNQEILFKNCINYWLDNDENRYPIAMSYTIKKLKRNAKKYLNEKNEECVDLMEIFEMFFSQKSKGIYFNLFELDLPMIDLE